MVAENPPTEKKLARLREKGIVPYSKVATFCVLIPLIIISSLSSYKHILNLKELISTSNLSEFTNLFGIILLPAAVVFLGVFLTIMLQTKFLLKPTLLIPQFSRINPFNRHFSIVSALSRILAGLIELCLFGAITAFTAYIALTGCAQIFNLPLEKAFIIFQKFGICILLILIFLCSICIVFGILASRYLFRKRHGMTREELELEERGLYD